MAFHPCDDCGNETNGWPCCDFCMSQRRNRSAAMRKASPKRIATRRRNNPNYGPPMGVVHGWAVVARKIVSFAKSIGYLPDLAAGEYACVDCGKVATDYDHRDYARPLDVEPVCRGCNSRRGTAKYPQPLVFRRVDEADTNQKVVETDRRVVALLEAVDVFGSQSKFADALSAVELGRGSTRVSQGHISKWLERGGAPDVRCIGIEIATRGHVTRYRLRPDVCGDQEALELVAA